MDNKTKEDVILRVFLKVFNEDRGYYGDNYGVAEMEQYLEEQRLFDSFKEEFQTLAGESWVERRNSIYFYKTTLSGP